MEEIQKRMNDLDNKLSNNEITLDVYYSLYSRLEDLKKYNITYYDYDENFMD